MRLIDADALLKEANKDGAYGYVDAKQIDDAPTIDAAEVVRCKYCRHSCEDLQGRFCAYHKCNVNDDWICTRWEAKGKYNESIR